MRRFTDARDFYGWLNEADEAEGEIPARTQRAWRRHEAMRRIRGGAAVDPVTGYPLHGPGGQVLPPERGLEVHQEVVGPAPDLIPGGRAPRTRPVLGPDYASAMAEAEAAGVNTRGFRAALERRVREGRVNPAWGESEDEPLFLPPLSNDTEQMAAPQATAGHASSAWGEMAEGPAPRLRGRFGPAGGRPFEPELRSAQGPSAEAGFGGALDARERGYGVGARGPMGAGAPPTERWGLLDVGPDLQPLRGHGVAPAMGRMATLSGAPDGPGDAPLKGAPEGWLSPPRRSRIDPASLPQTAAHMRRVSEALGSDPSGYGGSVAPNRYPLPFGHDGVSGQADLFGTYGAAVLAGGSGADRFSDSASTPGSGLVRHPAVTHRAAVPQALGRAPIWESPRLSSGANAGVPLAVLSRPPSDGAVAATLRQRGRPKQTSAQRQPDPARTTEADQQLGGPLPITFDRELAGRPGHHESAVYNFWRQRGWSHVAAAAITGGVYVESKGLNNEFITGGYQGQAYGVFQWLGTRKLNLFEFARRKGFGLWRNPEGGLDVDLQTQLEFAEAEMTPGNEFYDATSQRYVKALRSAKTLEEAAKAFTGFERPNSKGPDGRYTRDYNPQHPELTQHWEHRHEAAKRIAATYPTFDPAKFR